MEIYHINAALAAIGYSVAAVLSKQALSRGAGILRLSLAVNLFFVPVFSFLLFQHEGAIAWERIHQPILTGLIFFMGQIFTFAAIRVGDVSLQTPVMGTKAVFAVILVALLGIETIGFSVFIAAFFAMVGVAFLGFSGGDKERVGISIFLAMLSSLSFACSDIMVGVYAKEFGVPLYLFVTMATSALLSFGLVPFFREPMRAIPRQAWPWMLGACLLMGLQALLLNFTIGRYQHVAEVNVIYSTRGLWSVIFGAIAMRVFCQSGTSQGRILVMRFVGALLMCVAIFVLLYPKI